MKEEDHYHCTGCGASLGFVKPKDALCLFCQNKTFGRVIKHNIDIEASANNRFIVTVGCTQMVYLDKEELIAGLKMFLDDPEGMERKYNQMIQGTQMIKETHRPSSSSSSCST